MEIGQEVIGKIVKITTGRDTEIYATVEFPGWGNATLKKKKE